MIFSFAKVNGRPFHFFFLNIVQNMRRSSLRVWNNLGDLVDVGVEKEIGLKGGGQPVYVAKGGYQTSRLQELSLIVDTQGAFKGESIASANEPIKRNA